MILKNLKLFLQNVQKNQLLTETLLETNKDFDIIFIQEPSWSTIYQIPSFTSKEGEMLIEVPNHPTWLSFSRNPNGNNNSP